MKVFLTGQKQIGKSTCIDEFLSIYRCEVCGFKTLPYIENGKRVGFYMHSLIGLDENDKVFSEERKTIPNIFNDFGVKVLNGSNQGLLILDEIGFLERNETIYLRTLMNKIRHYPNILGVLRKCDMEYICEIKNMSDVQVIDLDTVSYQEALSQLKNMFEQRQND